MSKKLKLFGLLALVLALGAGVAWAVLPDHVLAGVVRDPVTLAVTGAGAFNTISGNGTQMGSVTGMAVNKILQLNAAKDSTVTLAPVDDGTTAHQIFREAAAAQLVQVVTGGVGKVVIQASNGDRPRVDAGNNYYTLYQGGTVQRAGTLGVSNNNSLGQRWVGVVGDAAKDKAPVFQVEGVDKVQLGVNDPANQPTFQPFFLLYNANDGAPAQALRHVKVLADAVSTKLQGLVLHHGLDQRVYTAPVSGAAAADTFITANDAGASQFVRLTKLGKGSLTINGDTSSIAAAGENLFATLPGNGGNEAGYRPVDGAHHLGGTVVEGGVLQVDGGNAAVANDHFRGSLGKVWTTFEGSASAPVLPYDASQYLAAAYLSGLLYNPLFIKNDAQVMVNRSQFFSDFNVEKPATFHVDEYSLAGTNYNPQIAVTLDRKVSKADGLLEGKFDLVLYSTNPVVANRPSNDPQSPAINNDGQATLFINNAENKIFDKGETLIANGILEIAGAKSIGGGKVTIGAVRAADRGFTTNSLATFASSKTFKLPNVTVGRAGGAAAVEAGNMLSFKDITLENMGVTHLDTFRINPFGVALGAGYNKIEPAAIDPFQGAAVADILPGNWTDTATVEFGSASSADAQYKAAGVMSHPTRVDVERGVWQLNNFPTPTATQQLNKENPFMHVYIYPTAVLSLAKDVNDFSPYMDLKVTDDSRIRVVLRDSDIAATREGAMANAPVFQAHHIDYSALGSGANHKDRRLAIQLDPSQLTSNVVKKGWVKLVFSPDAKNWNHLHYLRENSGVGYEDYAKVRLTWTTKSDIVNSAVAHVDENSYTILAEVSKDVTDPVDPTPGPVTTDLTAKVTAPATAKVGETVNFVIGKWSYKTSADVEVQNVVWTLDGVVKTVSGDKLSVPAVKGTMNLVVTAKLKANPAVEGKATASVTVSDGGVTPPTSSDSGGCDAGFAGLALLLAAPLFLRRKN